jgi:hypothetical protein
LLLSQQWRPEDLYLTLNLRKRRELRTTMVELAAMPAAAASGDK